MVFFIGGCRKKKEGTDRVVPVRPLRPEEKEQMSCHTRKRAPDTCRRNRKRGRGGPGDVSGPPGGPAGVDRYKDAGGGIWGPVTWLQGWAQVLTVQPSQPRRARVAPPPGVKDRRSSRGLVSSAPARPVLETVRSHFLLSAGVAAAGCQLLGPAPQVAAFQRLASGHASGMLLKQPQNPVE